MNGGFQPFRPSGTALVKLLATAAETVERTNNLRFREPTMTNFFNIDFNRLATAAVGALVLTTACVGAAVAPARAVETDTTIQVIGGVATDEAKA
jgi:hypothetical protein